MVSGIVPSGETAIRSSGSRVSRWSGQGIGAMNESRQENASAPRKTRSGSPDKGFSARAPKANARLSALPESEARLRRILDGSTDGYWEWDVAGDRVFLSDRAQRILGLELDCRPATRKDVRRRMHPEDVARVTAKVERVIRSRAGTDRYDMEHRQCLPDGEIVWVHTRARVTARDAGGRALKVSGLMTDITERKQAEEAYRILVDTALQGLVILQGARIVFANPAICEISGYSQNELYALPPMGFLKLVPPEDRLSIGDRYRMRLAGAPVPDAYETRLLRKDRDIRWMSVRIATTVFCGKPAVQSAYIDITAQKQAQHEKLRFERRVVEALDRERQRIGFDLHDGLGQTLAGLAYSAHALAEDLAETSASGAARASRMATQLRGAVEQARDLAMALCPVKAEPDGLAVCLERFCGSVEQLFHVRCRLACSKTVCVHDAVAANHLYRVVQESVHNAVQHGKADAVRVVIRMEKEDLSLVVRDNGQGFDTTRPAKRGLGLAAMQYRAGALGGNFTVTSERGKGTVVECRVPRSRLNGERAGGRHDGSERPACGADHA